MAECFVMCRHTQKPWNGFKKTARHRRVSLAISRTDRWKLMIPVLSMLSADADLNLVLLIPVCFR